MSYLRVGRAEESFVNMYMGMLQCCLVLFFLNVCCASPGSQNSLVHLCKAAIISARIIVYNQK